MIKVQLEKHDLPYDMNEELKQLRTNIQFCGDDKKVILVTSSFENEGKSTTALNLCFSFAELGKRVLLMDCDLRKSNLERKIINKEDAQYGLSHLLAGQKNLGDILLQVNESNFYMLPAGYFPPNPSELLANQRMDRVIEWARTQFDYVILDCPPLDVVVDASVVAPKCDGAIIVIAAGQTPYKQVQAVVQQLQNADCAILGVVLNKVDYRKQSTYYARKYGYGRYGYRKYGYRYGKRYGSGYGYGYGDELEPVSTASMPDTKSKRMSLREAAASVSDVPKAIEAKSESNTKSGTNASGESTKTGGQAQVTAVQNAPKAENTKKADGKAAKSKN